MDRAVLAVCVAVGVLFLWALRSRTFRRILATSWVGSKAAVAIVGARLRGQRDSGPALLRRAFEELGPTYVKLGQLIASSQGLFPERYSQEFRKCLDRVQPFAFDEVERILAADFGRPAHELFASLDGEPLASASIAQVHAGKLPNGQDVVVKVQRPSIDDIVDADLRVLKVIARVMAVLPRGEIANPRGVVEDFESNITEELDFRREAENMTEFNRIMVAHGQTQVAAPRPVAELTTKRVLVMERFFGCRVDDVEQLRAANIDVEATLVLGIRAWFQCLVVHGFFHGDVHAGNLMTLSDGRVGFLDFGIVGRFGRDRREQVTDYLMAFAAGDFRKLAEVMVAMSSAGPSVDVDGLAKDLAAAYEPMLKDEHAALKYADVIPAILHSAIRHGMRMPRDFVLVVKQMLYFDRYARLLAPKLNVFTDTRLVTALANDVMLSRTQAA